MAIVIELCPSCEGKGVKKCKQLVDYHKGIYDEWLERCRSCEGSGRLQTTTVTTTSPYIAPTEGVRDRSL